jgi:hypothetical protein
VIVKRDEIRKLHLCGLVVRVPGYRSRGPGFDSRALQGKKKSRSYLEAIVAALV